jgi:hypothetical protein
MSTKAHFRSVSDYKPVNAMQARNTWLRVRKTDIPDVSDHQRLSLFKQVKTSGRTAAYSCRSKERCMRPYDQHGQKSKQLFGAVRPRLRLHSLQLDSHWPYTHHQNPKISFFGLCHCPSGDARRLLTKSDSFSFCNELQIRCTARCPSVVGCSVFDLRARMCVSAATLQTFCLCSTSCLM